MQSFIPSPRKRKRSSQNTDVASGQAKPLPNSQRVESPHGNRLLENTVGEASSPRTIIAGRIQNLSIQESNNMPAFDTRPVTGNSADKHANQTSIPGRPYQPDLQPSGTPPAASCTPPSSSPSTLAAHMKRTPQHLIINSPPPDSPETLSLRSIRKPTPPLSDLRRSELESPAMPSRALWWSDAEITGHELDSRDPSDDGEGINGVGFLPTPAIAFARAERRRRQVSEWKERECKEARVKRAQKRRRHSLEDHIVARNTIESQSNERKVRFVEV